MRAQTVRRAAMSHRRCARTDLRTSDPISSADTCARVDHGKRPRPAAPLAGDRVPPPWCSPPPLGSLLARLDDALKTLPCAPPASPPHERAAAFALRSGRLWSASTDVHAGGQCRAIIPCGCACKPRSRRHRQSGPHLPPDGTNSHRAARPRRPAPPRGRARAPLPRQRTALNRRDRPPPRTRPRDRQGLPLRPHRRESQAVKARYRGTCRTCGADTSPRNGKDDAHPYCRPLPTRRRDPHLDPRTRARSAAPLGRALRVARHRHMTGHAPTPAAAARRRCADSNTATGPPRDRERALRDVGQRSRRRLRPPD